MFHCGSYHLNFQHILSFLVLHMWSKHTVQFLRSDVYMECCVHCLLRKSFPTFAFLRVFVFSGWNKLVFQRFKRPVRFLRNLPCSLSLPSSCFNLAWELAEIIPFFCFGRHHTASRVLQRVVQSSQLFPMLFFLFQGFEKNLHLKLCHHHPM